MGQKAEYVRSLAFDGERTRIPDFTIQTDDPERPIYWEHLGMLCDPRYATRWQEKRQWYARHGILPGPAGGPRGTLLATDVAWAEVVYEDVADDPARIADVAAGLVGVELREGFDVATRLQVQRDDWNDEVRRAWVHATGGCERGCPSGER